MIPAMPSLSQPLPAVSSTGLSVGEALDRSTLQTRAYEQLRRAVMGGVFRPGTPITLRAAAEALGTSLMPVRGALLRLELEGALVARDGRGTLAIPALSQEEYLELRDIGIVIEGMAAERAASRITDAEIAAVEASCAAMQASAEADDRHSYVTANWEVHRGTYQASRFNTLIGMIERRWLRIGPYVELMMPDRHSMIESMPNHWALVDALRRRHGGDARAAITEDISHCSVTLANHLGTLA